MSVHLGNGASTAVPPPRPTEIGVPPGPETMPGLPELLLEDPEQADLEEQLDRLARAPEPAAAPLPRKVLRSGCYLLRYTPTPPAWIPAPQHYDGTLRVERAGGALRASGDLYTHPRSPFPRPLPEREHNPSRGIPIFPIKRYRSYVRVTSIKRRHAPPGYRLGFELHRFSRASGTWTNEGSFSAELKFAAAPSGYPSPFDYLKGDVKDAAGTVVGELTMGWVSKHLRRAVIEIDRVPAAEPALANAAGIDWAAIFEQVGWQVTVDQSDANLSEPSGASWSDAEMHSTLLARRDSANLDAEWRYWLVCVRRLDSTERGIMFDAYAGDTNAIPREGAGISSHWVIPNAAPWGLVKGMRFGTATDPYFRTAVHELGHAMGLYHNAVDNGFMHTTPDIAANAVPPEQFPQNIQWSYAPDDQRRLRHMPDIWVRPGGIAFGSAYGTAPIVADDDVADADGLELGVGALRSSVPLGAPVRVELRLTNRRDDTVPGPHSLSLKDGCVSGRVIDPSGTVRSFRSLVRCIEHAEPRELAPGETITDSLTLLRGAEGALFPAPGAYRISVDVDWEAGDAKVRASAETAVMVTGVTDDAHADAALRVLSTPDILVTLALGGDHVEEGNAAVDAALADSTLRPHYAWIEAKRVGRPFFERPADIGTAAELVDVDTVMSTAEVRKAAALCERAEGETGPANGRSRMLAVLREKAAEVELDEETRRRLERP